MNLRLLTTLVPPPAGFEARLPDRRDLLGGPLALLLGHEDEIGKLLGVPPRSLYYRLAHGKKPL